MAKNADMVYYAPRRGYYKTIRLPRGNEARADSLRSNGPGTLAELYPNLSAAMQNVMIPFMGSIGSSATALKVSRVGLGVLQDIAPNEIIIDKIVASVGTASRLSMWRYDGFMGSPIVDDVTSPAQLEDYVYRPRSIVSGIEVPSFAKFFRVGPPATHDVATEVGARVWRQHMIANSAKTIYENTGKDDFRLQGGRCFYLSNDTAAVTVAMHVVFRTLLTPDLMGISDGLSLIPG